MTAALERARSLRRELALVVQLRVLPLPVALFQWRARRLAARTGDQFSIVSATHPRKLALLLELARDRRRVVELGTATGWTSLSLLLADPRRQVIGYDPFDRPERHRYLGLVRPAVAARAEFRRVPGEAGPRRPDEAVELLYIDSSHSREGTIRELQAWNGALAPGALVVFDDYAHPDYPGVREALTELAVAGEERAGLFVHRAVARRMGS